MTTKRFLQPLCAAASLTLTCFLSSTHAQELCRGQYTLTISHPDSEWRTISIYDLDDGFSGKANEIGTMDEAAFNCVAEIGPKIKEIDEKILKLYRGKFRIQDDTKEKVDKLIEECREAITTYGDHHIKAIRKCDETREERDELVANTDDTVSFIDRNINLVNGEKEKLWEECDELDAAYKDACESLQAEVKDTLGSEEAGDKACEDARNPVPAELFALIPDNCEATGEPSFEPRQKAAVNDSWVGGAGTFKPGRSSCVLPTENVVECKNVASLELLCETRRACEPQPYNPAGRGEAPYPISAAPVGPLNGEPIGLDPAGAMLEY